MGYDVTVARRRAWTDDDLRAAATGATSYKHVLQRLGFTGQGSTFWDVRHRMRELGLVLARPSTDAQGQWDNDKLRVLVASSTSYTSVVEGLGFPVTSSTYYRVKRRIGLLGLSTSHFRRIPNGRGGKRRWTDAQLTEAVAASLSMAGTIRRLGLIPAGGNYDQVRAHIVKLGLDTSHFTGQGWNRDGVFQPTVERPLEELLVANRPTSSHALKKRLFRAGLKKPCCELCGWAERAPDGRIPVELDHINGDKNDNRLENLRILCPNCHSLQGTHRGLNQRRRKN